VIALELLFEPFLRFSFNAFAGMNGFAESLDAGAEGY